MKKMLLILTLLLVATWAFAGWGTPVEYAADAGLPLGGHGVEVDPDGKIWYASYYNRDSIEVAGGTFTAISPIYVLNADGTQASFSPIRTITVDGVTDTLGTQVRGMNMDNNGNFVISVKNLAGSYDLYRINYQTGEGMAKLTSPLGTSTTAPGFDADGNMVIFNVVGTDLPIKQYDPDFEEIGDAAITTGICRTIEFSADGKDIYFFPFTAQLMVRFHSEDGVGGSYDVVDTLLRDMSIESVAWHPTTGNLWVSNDSRGLGATPCVHYAYDVVNATFVDSIVHTAAADSAELPRGIAFAADGNTAYTTHFNGFLPNALYQWTKNPDGVWENTAVLANGYALKANYPNPFNPTTNLDYVLDAAGLVDIRVYDITGAEVAVLANSYQGAGSHTLSFDASNLASGVYVAKMNVNGVQLSRNMMLVK
jgi:hypothetical protein